MVALTVGCAVACATDSIAVDYSVGITVNTGGSELAPYYISSNRRGTVTQQHSVLMNACVKREMDTTRRLSWGAGVEVWGGWSSSVDYQRYDSESGAWTANPQHPARVWLQQVWIEGKHRGVMLIIGQKDIDPGFVNRQLSSGDLVIFWLFVRLPLHLRLSQDSPPGRVWLLPPQQFHVAQASLQLL